MVAIDKSPQNKYFAGISEAMRFSYIPAMIPLSRSVIDSTIAVIRELYVELKWIIGGIVNDYRCKFVFFVFLRMIRVKYVMLRVTEWCIFNSFRCIYTP